MKKLICRLFGHLFYEVINGKYFITITCQRCAENNGFLFAFDR